MKTPLAAVVLAALVLVAALSPTRAFAQGEPTPAEAFCAKRDACNGTATAGICVGNAQSEIDAAAAQGDAACTAVADAYVTSLSCQAAADCADLIAGTACVEEIEALNQLYFDGAFGCISGDPPVSAPEGWLCAAAFFGAEDGCDCGCGIVDDDCGGNGCGDLGCREDACNFCFDDAAARESGTASAGAPDAVGCEGEGEGEGEGEAGEGEGEGDGGGEGEGDDDDDDTGGGCNASSGSRAVFALALAALLIRRRIR